MMLYFNKVKISSIKPKYNLSRPLFLLERNSHFLSTPAAIFDMGIIIFFFECKCKLHASMPSHIWSLNDIFNNSLRQSKHNYLVCFKENKLWALMIVPMRDNISAMNFIFEFGIRISVERADVFCCNNCFYVNQWTPQQTSDLALAWYTSSTQTATVPKWWFWPLVYPVKMLHMEFLCLSYEFMILYKASKKWSISANKFCFTVYLRQYKHIALYKQFRIGWISRTYTLQKIDTYEYVI